MTNPVRPVVVVWFAGGGGSSKGVAQAFGADPDYALNHNATALRMHEANHPGTAHLCEDARATRPEELEPGRPIDLFWASPDCTHHSKARGAAPKSDRIRGLAWVVADWAERPKAAGGGPRVIILENVEEFRDWGPIDGDGRTIPDRKGETFAAFVARLRAAGYAVDWRELVAADYGAPTTRKRFFLIARNDGQPIAWPARTHAPAAMAREVGVAPWRSAASIIDWAVPCPSIFDRSRPLVEKTLQRIAKGIERYVIRSASPFIVPITHTGVRVHDIDQPLRTVCAQPKRGELALVCPAIVAPRGWRMGTTPAARGCAPTPWTSRSARCRRRAAITRSSRPSWSRPTPAWSAATPASRCRPSPAAGHSSASSPPP
jgi:DNA (cytosine-5)-methyltransferase 1